MTINAADSVKVEWTGTGGDTPITLGSAVLGFQAVPSGLDGKTVSYLIEHKGAGIFERENGRGVYTHSGTTLARTDVTFSTASNGPVDFSAGTKHISIVPLAGDFGEMADQDNAAGNRQNWGQTNLNAAAGNVTFDGSAPTLLVRVHSHAVGRTLTITPAPTMTARTLIILNDGDGDVEVLDHSSNSIDTVLADTIQTFHWAASAWLAGLVWPGGDGGGGGGDASPTRVTVTNANTPYTLEADDRTHLNVEILCNDGANNLVVILPEGFSIGSWIIKRGSSHTGSVLVRGASSSVSIDGIVGPTLGVNLPAENSSGLLIMDGSNTARWEGASTQQTTAFADHDMANFSLLNFLLSYSQIAPETGSPNTLISIDSDGEPSLLPAGNGITLDNTSIRAAFGSTSTTVAAGNRGLLAGGSTGQVLAKASGSDYDVEWVTGSGGSGSDYDFVEDDADYSGTPFQVDDGALEGQERRFTAIGSPSPVNRINFPSGIPEDSYGWFDLGTGAAAEIISDAGVTVQGAEHRGGGSPSEPALTIHGRVSWRATDLNVIEIEGAISEGRQNVYQLTHFNGAKVQGNLAEVITATGTLNVESHLGAGIITSGNVTIPTTTGFNCTLIAGGAHTVSFNGTTSPAMASGGVMTVLVQSATVIKAAYTAPADLVSFS